MKFSTTFETDDADELEAVTKAIAEAVSSFAKTKIVHSVYNVDTPIKDLDISTRTCNVLIYERLLTVGDVLRNGREKTLAIPNFGKRCILEIDEAFEAMCFKLI